MKKFGSITLILLSMMLMASTCNKNRHHDIEIKNLSDKTIYYLVSFNYPDTTLQGTTGVYNEDKIFPANSSFFIWGSDAFKINDTLQFFIFDATVIENTTWDTIKANYLILKSYEETKLEMKIKNWTITYP